MAITDIDHLQFSRADSDAYIAQLTKECASDTALPEISYRYETEKKTQAIAQNFFSYLYSLGSLSYELIHRLAGLCIRITTCRFLSGFTKQRINTDLEYEKNSMNALFSEYGDLENPPEDPEQWKYKRISVEVDGCLIDAMLIIRDSTATNGRWLLNSNTNCDFYELHKKYNTCPKKLAFCLDTNILIFNDPGVGASQGSYTRAGVAKSYRAMLRFLEDKEKGIGATTIIAKGFCLGGNIQGEALKDHELQPEIQYVFIKDRSACKFSKAASCVTFCLIGKLVELCGWNMDTLSSSKQLKAHEIFLHTAHLKDAAEIIDPELLIDDGVLGKKETVGYHLLKDRGSDLLENKTVIGIPEFHRDSLSPITISVLTEKIQAALGEK